MSAAIRAVLLSACVVVSAGCWSVTGIARAESNDLGYDAGLQWGLDVIGAEAAWAEARGEGIVIAVVDSGVQRTHVDLRDQLVEGISCIGTDGVVDRCAGAPDDDNGHGTHVAGIAAARTGNGIGVAGTAPDARILPVRVLRQQCNGDVCRVAGNEADVAAGIRWAVDQGADIVNLSLGSSTDSVLGERFAEAVRYAWDNGAIAVVAAGNDYVLQPEFGELPAVVVASTNRSDRAPGYSNGVGTARWAISAPGGDEGDEPGDCAIGGSPNGILSTYYGADDDEVYACLAGTSMAAPHVSGALAILRSQGLAPEAAVQRILDTAIDLGDPGPDPTYGVGRLDLARAAGATVGATPTTRPPADTTTTTTRPDEGVVPATATTSPPTTATVVGDGGAETTPTTLDPAPVPPPVVFEQADGPGGGVGTSTSNGPPPGLVALAAVAIAATGVASTLAYRRLGI